MELLPWERFILKPEKDILNKLYCTHTTSLEHDPYNFLYIPFRMSLYFLRHCNTFREWGPIYIMEDTMIRINWTKELFYEIK